MNYRSSFRKNVKSGTQNAFFLLKKVFVWQPTCPASLGQ